MSEEKFDWSKFDKSIDVEGLEQDVQESENVSDYPEIPDGEYDVTITNMELGKSKVKDNGKGGDPMVKIAFRIMAGEFKDNYIFYNGVVQMWQKDSVRRFQIHNLNVMLRAIADDNTLSWKSFADLAKILDDQFEDVGTFKNDDDTWDEGDHFQLSQTTNAKNSAFKDLEILGVLD